MKSKIVMMTLVGTLFLGCNADIQSSETVPNKKSTPETTPKQFSDVLGALQSDCLSCHGTNGAFTLGSSSNPLSTSEAHSNILNYVSGANSASETVLLQKATGAIAHGGGTVFTDTSNTYQLVAAWIEAGTPSDTTEFLLQESRQRTQDMTYQARQR